MLTALAIILGDIALGALAFRKGRSAEARNDKQDEIIARLVTLQEAQSMDIRSLRQRLEVAENDIRIIKGLLNA